MGMEPSGFYNLQYEDKKGNLAFVKSEKKVRFRTMYGEDEVLHRGRYRFGVGYVVKMGVRPTDCACPEREGDGEKSSQTERETRRQCANRNTHTERYGVIRGKMVIQAESANLISVSFALTVQ